MNQIVAYRTYAAPATRSKAQDPASLLRKITAWFKPALTIRFPKNHARDQHQSFMDANLLDAAMGPEISRTLRR